MADRLWTNQEKMHPADIFFFGYHEIEPKGG